MATSDSAASSGGGDAEKKATATENMTNLTSGARERVSGATADARAATAGLRHPFNKEAKQDAVAKARDAKSASAEREMNVRADGAQQASQRREAASGPSSHKDFPQHFSDDAPATFTGNPGAASAPVQQPAGGQPPLGGTEDSAYRNIKDEDDPPVSTMPRKGIAPTGRNGELETHDF